MENAKRLREEKLYGAAEDASFTPQINRRPAYLKQQDSLDQLAIEVIKNPNDVFEQPLPGTRKQQQVDHSAPSLPSPGSDALGKEMKRYHNDENRSTQGPYKSKFLQQYENELAPENDQTSSSGYGANYRKQQQQAIPPQKAPSQQPEPAPYGRQSHSQVQDPDDGFINSLRGAGGGGSGKKAVPSAGPGWNDDIATDGFGEARSLKPKASATKGRPRAPAQQSSNYDDDGGVYAQQDYNHQRVSPQKPAARQQQQQQSRTLPHKDWNMDTEFTPDAPMATLPPKISPRISPRVPAQRNAGRVDSEVAANQARPTLSLLKSKIRRSESGRNVLTMDSTDSTASLASNSYSANDSVTSEQVADIRRSGRRSAPNVTTDRGSVAARQQQAPSNGYGQYEEVEDQGYGHGRANSGGAIKQPPQRGQPPPQPSRRPAAQQFQQQQSQYNNDHEDDPYGPDAYPPGQYPPKFAPAAKQQPPQRSQPPSQPSRRPAAQQQQQQQYEDDPYGPDAYPPGDYPPKFTPSAASAPSEYPDDNGEQRECPDCGRKFNPIPYEKHVKICKKVFLQKRKVYDSTKKRLATGDPEMEKLAVQASKEAAKLRRKKEAMEAAAAAAAEQNAFAGSSGFPGPGNNMKAQAASQAMAPPAKKQTNQNSAVKGGGGGGGCSKEEAAAKWRDQSNAFREAMKAARQYSKAVAEGKPLPPPVASAPDKSLVPCPHCGRSFNEKAAERHIPQCQNIRAKPSALKRGAGGGGGVNGSLAATSNASAKNKRGGFM